MHRRILISGLIATAALSAVGSAAARPTIDTVEVDRLSPLRAEVSVELARGTAGTAPTVTVIIGRRTLRLPVRDWDRGLAAEDTVTAARSVKVRTRSGRAIRIRVRACDAAGCVATTRRVTVLPAAAASLDDAVPLPDGAVDLGAAVETAFTAEPGSQLVKAEREDDYGAAWEVRVRRADDVDVKLYIGADGEIVRTRVERSSGHHRPLPALPDGAVSPVVAIGTAVAHVGGGTAYEVRRSRRPGSVWKIEVVGSDLVEHEVFVSVDGLVVASEVDDDDRDDGRVPLPPGAISAERAAELAVAHLGGGVVREVERTRDRGAIWKVEVRMADGSKHKVYIGADGAVLAADRDGASGDGSNGDGDSGGDHEDDRPPAPPAGAVTSQQAAAAAVAHLGGGNVREVRRTSSFGAVWKVEVRMADRTEYEVYVAADGSVIRADRDD